MKETRPWPENVCSDSPLRPTLHKLLRWPGWIVATDGQILAAIPDDGREAEDHDGSTRLIDWLTAALPSPVELPLDALREWAGPEWTEGGECICDCGHEHRRPVGPDSKDRLGTIGDVILFNRRLLARLLDGAPGETVTISGQDYPMKPILLRGEAWSGFLMPIREGYVPEPDAQVEPVESLLAKASP